MTRGQLRHRILLRLRNYKGHMEVDFENSKELVNALIDEGSREFLRETLLLEGKNSSLTYNSTYDGCSLPSDFIRVKYLEWESTDGFYSLVQANSIANIKEHRNEWKDLSDESAKEISPKWYTIFNGYIILDSETEESPVLYYYKYDSELSSDSSSPSFSSEWHKYLIDYAVWQLTGDVNAQKQWEYGLVKARSKKRLTGNIRAKYIDL